MTEVQTKVNSIKKMQKTVDDLLKAGELHLCGGCLKVSNDSVVMKSIYSNGITVNITTFKSKGSVYPAHCHLDSVQVIVCIKGALIVTFEDMAARSVHSGEVVVLKPKEMHSLQAIEDDTKVLDVCVPREKAYQLGKITAEALGIAA